MGFKEIGPYVKMAPRKDSFAVAVNDSAPMNEKRDGLIYPNGLWLPLV